MANVMTCDCGQVVSIYPAIIGGLIALLLGVLFGYIWGSGSA